MAAPARVFPVPPPTINDLTPQQRTQLLRKAKKIEQLLGATPHLVDITATEALGPIHITLPYHRASFSGHRSSFDSTISRSSAGSLKRSASAASSSRRTLISHHASSTLSVIDTDKVPVLQLSMDSLTLNPPSNRTSVAESACSPRNSVDYSAETSRRSSRDSLVLDSKFIIPTPNSLRKQKMDRLRKKLGGDVPYHLVFPKDTCTVEKPRPAAASVFSPPPKVEVDNASPPLPPPPAARARKHTGPRIAHARDSIVDAASIHRARRQIHVAGAAHPRPAIRRQDSLASTDFRRVKNRLSFIIENPDEHKAGFLNEYGLQVTRVSSDDGADVISEWFGTNVSLWTGRKGCDNITGVKRRPSSYRKPPPPVPVECLVDSQ